MSMFTDSHQSAANVPDRHNITAAFEDNQTSEKFAANKKPIKRAIDAQEYKVCRAIKTYNLKVRPATTR